MKIAVIGAGISGLGSALLLSQQHDVHLFESEPRLGGHAHTVNVRTNQKPGGVALDTGFLVYNELTYPHFTKMLNYLDVKTIDSDMTLSIQTGDGLEWAGTNLDTVFAQRMNLFKPSYLSMLLDILRFHKQAHENLELSQKNQWTLQQLLDHRGHGKHFRDWYLLPMTGAIWSMSFHQSLSFPAETFLNFCMNHRLLQVNERPIWKTIHQGSINYVQKIASRLSHIHLRTPIDRLHRTADGKVRVHGSGTEMDFDKVILATHAPVSKKILGEGFPEFQSFLKNLKTNRNEVVLHRDASAMPKTKKCWSAWNVRSMGLSESSDPIVLTYDIDRLQKLNSGDNHFVTLNSKQKFQNVDQTFQYDHPQFDFELIQAQKKLDQFQGIGGVYLAGAWTRYGFHEDGLLSGVKVAGLLGVQPPWGSQ